MADLYQTIYTPDVLTCLANLSNDEVFTPPEVANQMLDLLPAELWRDSSATFLDPACKSGVFLREIAKRLIEGLANEIPDLQERIDHIFHKQLYGIAITELTSLLSRRSAYCSKFPNSPFSISRFDDSEGNIRFKHIQHSWQGGKCVFCGASESEYARGDTLETHAYEWIHTLKPEEIFNMKFDVIIGNPPYQLSDGGNGASATPIYQYFITQAKKIKPRYITMIVPARWYSGGRGLDTFRNEMLNDTRIRTLHDFPNASEVFPGVEIKGGVCYFLWNRDSNGDCTVSAHNGPNTKTSIRPLLEDGMDTFIRNAEQISIFRKVQCEKETSFADIVSANDPFGFDVRETNSYRRVRAPYSLTPFDNSVTFYYNGWRKDGLGYVDAQYIRKNIPLVSQSKVFVPRVWGSGTPSSDRVNPFIPDDVSCGTETYLSIGPFDNKTCAENAISYMQTKFFHFMVFLVKNTQQAMKKVYQFVPIQDFSKPWTDEELYEKYNLSDEEIAFIESMIRPMEGGGTDGG